MKDGYTHPGDPAFVAHTYGQYLRQFIDAHGSCKSLIHGKELMQTYIAARRRMRRFKLAPFDPKQAFPNIGR